MRCVFCHRRTEFPRDPYFWLCADCWKVPPAHTWYRREDRHRPRLPSDPR